MPDSTIDLAAILAARDDRARLQSEFIRRWGKPLASLTLVSPGSLKDSPAHRTLMDRFAERLASDLESAGVAILEMLRRDSPAGPEAFLVADCPAPGLKLAAMRLEDGLSWSRRSQAEEGCRFPLAWGRLLDADVLAPGSSIPGEPEPVILHGESFGRPPRTCLVCSRPAVECMGERRHSPRELSAAADSLLALAMRDIAREDSAAEGLASRIADLAVSALRAEAALAPKPGLVDPFHQGAHADMDYALLLRSAEALRPAFRACAAAGLDFDRAEPSELLPLLRPLGKAGEQAMFEATGGVNTHKGAVFCIGLLCAAAGFAYSRHGYGLRGEDLCLLVGRICQGMVETELGSAKGGPGGPGRPGATGDSAAVPGRTAGERLHQESGIRGARGQAEDGFPVIREAILPRLRSAREKPESGAAVPSGADESQLDALLASMAVLEDSCILSRGGAAGLAFVRERAAAVLAAGGSGTESGLVLLRRLDADLHAKRISPGGSADLLAAGLFLLGMEALRIPFQEIPR